MRASSHNSSILRIWLIALWKDAAEVAFKLKDARRLQEVKYKCSSSNAPNVDEIVALVDDRLGKLR